MLESHFVVCDCEFDAHTARFSYLPPAEGWPIPELYLHIQLHQWRGFWKRLKVAIGYLFKREQRYGYWDTTTINTDNALKLRDFLNEKFPLDKHPAS